MTNKQSIEDIVKEDSGISKKKAAIADIFGNTSYSLVAGAVLDYSAGLSPLGILASRLSASGFNLFTSAPYGWWREQAYHLTKTEEESNPVRKTIVDLLAFNTFQVPIYASGVAIGSLISEGHVNVEKMKHGSEYLAMISPIIGPTLGIYMDFLRKKVFKINSAAQGAYYKKQKND